MIRILAALLFVILVGGGAYLYFSPIQPAVQNVEKPVTLAQ